MKRLTLTSLFLILALLLPAAPLRADTLLDNFNRADNTDIGANWDVQETGRDCQIVSNKLRATGDATRCHESWNANTYSNEQTARATIVTLTASASDVTVASVMLRVSTPGTMTFYRCMAVAGAAGLKTEIRKVVDGTQTSIASENASGDWATSDVLKCTASGLSTVALTVYKNDVSILTYSDSTSPLTGDRIGAGCFARDDLSLCEIDDFYGADPATPPESAGGIMVITVE